LENLKRRVGAAIAAGGWEPGEAGWDKIRPLRCLYALLPEYPAITLAGPNRSC
jgi:hypothetical protein